MRFGFWHGEKNAARTADTPSTLVDVVAVIRRPRLLAAEMPFPGKERFITVITQHFGEVDLLVTQVSVILSGQMCGVESAPAPHIARGVTDPNRNAVLRGICR